MERRPTNAQEDDEPVVESSAAPRRMPRFYAALERFGLLDNIHEKEDDDEEDDSDSSKGRFKRAFKNIFSKLVEPAPLVGEESEEQKARGFRLPLFNLDEVPYVPQTTEPDVAETPDAIVPEPSRENSGVPLAVEAPAFVVQPAEQVNDEEPTAAGNIEPPQSPPPTHEVPEQQSYPESPVIVDRLEDRHRVETPEATINTKEVIVEKRGGGAALAALAAAELLSRSRDKKLRAEAAKTKERVKKLEKKTDIQEAIIETQHTRINSLKNQPESITQTSPRSAQAEQYSNTVVEKPTPKEWPEPQITPPVEKKPIQPPVWNGMERPPSIKTHETTQSQASQSKEYTPEYKAIVEHPHERYHEVKDEPGKNSHQNTTTQHSGSYVGAASPSGNSTPHSHVGSSVSSQTTPRNVATGRSLKDEMYQQAIKAGIGAGALIVIIALLLVALGVI